MRKLGLAWLLLGLGCSGGGGSDKGNAAVDPAAQDFCIDWSNGVCRLAYLCVDAGAQDAAFHARYGASQDKCFDTVQKLCTSNQSGSQAFGPSCGPGKKVNSTAASLCTQNLEIETCTEWMAAPDGACGSACSSVGNVGSGGASGNVAGAGNAVGSVAGAGNAVGAGGGATNPGGMSATMQFCAMETSVQCDRIFECDPTDAMAVFGTVEACKTATAAQCASRDCPNGIDSAKAAGCLEATKTATCDQLMGPAPEVCTSICQ
jgi:hypothetical protein